MLENWSVGFSARGSGGGTFYPVGMISSKVYKLLSVTLEQVYAVAGSGVVAHVRRTP